jgi:hypothetical protein
MFGTGAWIASQPLGPGSDLKRAKGCKLDGFGPHQGRAKHREHRVANGSSIDFTDTGAPCRDLTEHGSRDCFVQC